MIKPDITYTETNYLYDKFANEEYKPRSRWNKSVDFTPDPILTDEEYLVENTVTDTLEISEDLSSSDVRT